MVVGGRMKAEAGSRRQWAVESHVRELNFPGCEGALLLNSNDARERNSLGTSESSKQLANIGYFVGRKQGDHR